MEPYVPNGLLNIDKETKSKRSDVEIEIAHLLVLLSNQKNPSASDLKTFAICTEKPEFQHNLIQESQQPEQPYQQPEHPLQTKHPSQHSEFVFQQPEQQHRQYPEQHRQFTEQQPHRHYPEQHQHRQFPEQHQHPEYFHQYSDYHHQYSDYHQYQYSDYHQYQYPDYHSQYSFNQNHNFLMSYHNPIQYTTSYSHQHHHDEKVKRNSINSNNNNHSTNNHAVTNISHSNTTNNSSNVMAGTKKLATAPSGLPCPNCGIETSTLWRNCNLLDGSKYLCNACGLRYKKGKYCPLCYEVYYDVDTNHFNWEQCKSCLNWTHKACIQKAAIIPGPFGYVCKLCINGRGIMCLTTMDQLAKSNLTSPYDKMNSSGSHPGV